MNEHEKINYVEFPAKNIEATKDFFTTVFGWSFVDYGPDYTAFANEGIDGGFFQSSLSASTEKGSALIIFYSKDLEHTQAKIEGAGGSIIKPIFSFPGGRRFHFTDPNGNEYAVWSDVNAQQGSKLMLILKCTQKAAKELGLKRGDLPQIPPENNTTLLGDWFVNPLRFGYTKTLLFANALTLYSILVEYKKEDLIDIGQFFKTNLKFNLLLEGLESEKIDRILAEYEEVTLAKTDSRSVLGSMNDLARLYEYLIVGQGGIKQADLSRVIQEINRTPQLKRDGHYSIRLLKEKITTIS